MALFASGLALFDERPFCCDLEFRAVTSVSKRLYQLDPFFALLTLNKLVYIIV